MAKITIAGDSYVVTSEISMEDLKTVEKYRPSAMTLVNEETKEAYFRVGTGSNSISDYGISFGGVSNGTVKLATTTLCIPSDVEDKKEFVLDKAGLAMANLNKIEGNILGALEEILAQRDAISANIEVSI